MVEISAALQDFSHEAGFVGVTVTHSSKDLDFIVESFDDGRGQSGRDIGFDIFAIFSKCFGKF